jgi:hypothetical protein
LFLLFGVVYGAGIGLDCFCINGMCRGVMTAGGLPRTQPYGSVVPFGRTEAGTFSVQYLVSEF